MTTTVRAARHRSALSSGALFAAVSRWRLTLLSLSLSLLFSHSSVYIVALVVRITASNCAVLLVFHLSISWLYCLLSLTASLRQPLLIILSD